MADAEYKKHFDDEVVAFKDRIKKRAAQKIEEALAEQEEEERQARLGPGGLDPAEVFETLPEVSASGVFFFPHICDGIAFREELRRNRINILWGSNSPACVSAHHIVTAKMLRIA